MPSPPPPPPAIPLVVDLDGTLIKTDLLFESAVQLLRRNPLYAFLLPFWLLRGKHVLKRELARRVTIDPAFLPCNDDFLQFLQAERAQGRQLVLATASHMLLAQRVFDHHGLFSELLSTDDAMNLSGSRKRDALVARFGNLGFDYAGNASVDLAIWRSARKAIVVNPSAGVEARARALGNVDQVFSDGRSAPALLARSLRMHQWLKNLLVFAPLIAAHMWSDRAALQGAVTVFLAFCLSASAIYQVNDILDVEADRSHPRKRTRPIAAGDVSIPAACAMALALLTAGLALASLVSASVVSLLLLYLVGTSAYSFVLRSQPLLDLVALASLYTMRIVAGAAAIVVVPSFWLLAFSMFLFLSLATLKRCAELRNAQDDDGPSRSGRGYRFEDLPYLTGFGASVGTGAVVILALFINSPETAGHYGRPEFLWLLCPLLVYWIGRMWLKTGRGEMHDDPIVFAARDRVSLLITLVALVLVLSAV